MFAGLPGGSNGGDSGSTTALLIAALSSLTVFGALVYYAITALPFPP